MNLLFPAAAFGAYYLFSMKDTGEKLRRCEISSFKLGKLQLSLQQSIIPVELQVFNPNNTDVPAEYFRGIVSRAGKKIGDFQFDSKGKAVMLKQRTTTPLTFNVRISTVGVVSNLVNIFKNLSLAKPIDTTFTINGILTISGFDVPVNFTWDVKAGKEVKAVSGISGPYIGEVVRKNFHVLKVSYIGPSNSRESRVKISSERFQESVTINYDHRFDGTKDIALDWLDKKGFDIVGFAESKDGYYIISNTFQSLKTK